MRAGIDHTVAIAGVDPAAAGDTGMPVAEAVSAAAGGCASTNRLLSAANTTNPVNVKATPGRVYAIQGYNAAAAVRFLKLYNKATAPTVGTDVPVKTIPLAASAPFNFTWPAGYFFSLGIGFGLNVDFA